MMPTRTTLLVAAAASLAPAVALAADVPGNAQTRATLRIGPANTPGVFESPSDTDWYRVRLAAGTDYVVSGGTRSGYGIRLRLRDSRGRIVVAREEGGADTDVGFEFRPRSSGTYFVEALYLPDQSFLYNVRVSPDCRGDRTTQCALRLGVAQQRLLAYAFDDDWFSVELTRGRTYSVAAPGLEVSFRDARGNVVARNAPFTPGASGTYFATVSPTSDNGSGYRVTLTSP